MATQRKALDPSKVDPRDIGSPCSACGLPRTIDDLVSNGRMRKSTNTYALYSKCRACHNKKERRRYIHQATNDMGIYLRRKLSQLRYHRTKQGMEFSITEDDLLELFKRQEGRCALSGVQMTHIIDKGHISSNASIDRINDEIGYVISNVQLTCAAVNMMKRNLPQDEFVAWCSLVVSLHNENTSSHSPSTDDTPPHTHHSDK